MHAADSMVTEAGREERETWLVCAGLLDRLETRRAQPLRLPLIRRKVKQSDQGAYAQPCELAVLQRRRWMPLDDEVVTCVKAPGLLGRFEAVHLVDCDGTRVYADVLGDVAGTD